MLLHLGRRRRYTLGLLAVVFGLGFFGMGVTADAQRRKKIVLSEFVIEGRVQKPQAFLLLQRQNLNFEGLELKRSFVPKIISSMDEKPF